MDLINGEKNEKEELVEDLSSSTVLEETRTPCCICGRKFNSISLQKHVSACERNQNKKRKTFDSAKQRIQGTELEDYTESLSAPNQHPHTASLSKSLPKRPVRKKASLTSKKIKNVIPSNSAISTLTASSVYAPSKLSTGVTAFATTHHLNGTKSSSQENCIYCGRSFNLKAIDRHVQWCKEHQANKSYVVTANASVLEAKERLEARIHYRAPSLKLKRTDNISNYASSDYYPKIDSRTISPVSSIKSHCVSLKDHQKITKISKNIKQVKKTNFIRENVMRFSHKNKKRPSEKRDNDIIDNARDISQSHLHNWLSTNGKINQIVSHEKPMKNSSFHDHRSHNPYELAEQQLEQLLNLNSKSNILQTETNNVNKNNNNNTLTKKQNKTFKTSPTSAFEVYLNNSSKDKNDHSVNNDYYAYNAHSNELMNPNRMRNYVVSEPCVNKSNDMIRYPSVNLSTLSLCSSISLDIVPGTPSLLNDGDVTPKINTMLSPSLIDGYYNNNASRVNVKKNLCMENLLFGGQDCGNQLQPQNSNFKDSFDELESMIQSTYYDEKDNVSVRGLNESPNSSKDINSMTPLSMSPQKESLSRACGETISIDSAYNSLNRRSPPISPDSSSMMESSITSTCSISPSRRKPSNYCHECGAKFPLTFAKFCCECGIRRLIL